MASTARASTGPVTHHAYVLVVNANQRAPTDVKSRKLTLRILTYIKAQLPIFGQMGVRILVHKIRRADLQKPKVREAMRGKGITSLPAVVTPNETYAGAESIIALYDRNIETYQAWARRSEEPAGGGTPEDILDDFYRKEMSFDRVEQDDATIGDGMDEGGGMMGAYRNMQQRREVFDAQRNVRGGGDGIPDPAPVRSAATRRDNVGSDDGPGPHDSLADRMSGEISPQTRDAAFGGGGGDSFDDGGAGDAQDDMMAKQYWANQEMSM